MKKLFEFLLLFVLIPAIGLAATSEKLKEIRIETEDGYTISYTDHGEPALAVDKGYSSIHRTVEDEKIVEERYYDETGQLINVLGACCVVYSYPEEMVVRKDYYNEDGRLVINAAGYASIICTLDVAGRVIKEIYLDELSRPARHANGYYGISRDTFDCYDRPVRYTYLDRDGEPVLLEAGYASLECVYDEEGFRREEMYFMPDGRSAVLGHGQSGSRYIRDGEGRHIGTIFLDASGNPMEDKQGCGRTRYELDALGNVTKCFYEDLEGRPVEIKKGVLVSVSRSMMPRSASLAVASVPCLSVSAFLRSSSLVASVTAFWAFMAC